MAVPPTVPAAPKPAAPERARESVAALRKRAKAAGLTGYSRLARPALVALLTAAGVG